jgi:predicted amidohydrolase
MKIASVQIPNSISIEDNFKNILRSLKDALEEGCELVLFPECSLSGFTSEMKKCTMDFLKPFLDQIREISFQKNVTIVLPSAYVEETKIYNAIFIFDSNKMMIQYKIGLTESEQRFFSIPESTHPKIFTLKGIRVGVLVCFEAQMAPYSFIKEGEVDLILWPGYILSGDKKEWNVVEKNEVYQNMTYWKVPLIQSNFSFNDLSIGKERGPDGHSVVLDKNNNLVQRGKYQENDIIITNFNDLN